MKYAPLDSFASNASYLHNIHLLCIPCEQKKCSIGAFSLYNAQLSYMPACNRGKTYRKKQQNQFNEIKR